MLVNASTLIGCPVLSLHVGGRIASISQLYIDPNTLKLLAVRLEGLIDREVEGDLLPVESIREFSQLGVIIDSTDEIISDETVIKIRDVLKLNFALPGLKVITQKKSKVGKVIDFTLDISTWDVYQLIVQRPALKAFFDPELTISRQSIIEVNDYQVIIKDEHEKVPETEAKPEFTPNFVNPFRKPELATPHSSGE